MIPRPLTYKVHFDTAGPAEDADPAETWAFEDYDSLDAALARAHSLRNGGVCAQILERHNFKRSRFGWEFDELLLWEDGVWAQDSLAHDSLDLYAPVCPADSLLRRQDSPLGRHLASLDAAHENAGDSS